MMGEPTDEILIVYLQKQELYLAARRAQMQSDGKANMWCALAERIEMELAEMQREHNL